MRNIADRVITWLIYMTGPTSSERMVKMVGLCSHKDSVISARSITSVYVEAGVRLDASDDGKLLYRDRDIKPASTGWSSAGSGIWLTTAFKER